MRTTADTQQGRENLRRHDRGLGSRRHEDGRERSGEHALRKVGRAQRRVRKGLPKERIMPPTARTWTGHPQQAEDDGSNVTHCL